MAASSHYHMLDMLARWCQANGLAASIPGPAEQDHATRPGQIWLDESDFPALLKQTFTLCRQKEISFILLQRRSKGREIVFPDPVTGKPALRLQLLPAGHAKTRDMAGKPRWAARLLTLLLKSPVPGTAAVVGPDGSGKTALIDACMARGGSNLQAKNFKRYFRRPLPYLLRHESRNDRDENSLWLILPVAWVYFLVSRWCTGWWYPLVLDRYFYDYFVRDVRRHDRPMRRIRAYGLCSLLVPCPQKLLVAMCQNTNIHARKTEMTSGAIDSLYEVYLDQVVRSQIPASLFCHTALDISVSSRQAADFLFEVA